MPTKSKIYPTPFRISGSFTAGMSGVGNFFVRLNNQRKGVWVNLIGLIIISAVLLVGLTPSSVRAVNTAPTNSCPYLNDLGYCKEGGSSYYCGLKFNETGTLTIRFASDNVKIDQDGNAFFNYYDEGITQGDYIIDSGQNQFIINRNKDLVISADNITLFGGAGSIIANDANVGTRTKAADDIEINKNPGARVAFYDASEGKLYVKGQRIVNGDAVPAGNSFFTAYDASTEESKAHYCKKFGSKFTLQYGCFIGSTDKIAGEKEIANGCNQCDPNANLFDWSATATGGTCALASGKTGTCATGNCVCSNAASCDDGIFCNGAEDCTSQTCQTPGNPCVATNQDCDETNKCHGCINDSACSGATPACEASNNTCKQCTSSNQTKCNDNLSCTLDSCGSNSCSNTLIAGNCLIAGVCYPNGAANPVNDCQKCSTGQSTSAWSPKSAGTACGSSANSTCDAADTCNAGGTCLTNYAPTTTIYAAATDCKNAVYCDGSGSYGSLTNKANGTVCTDDGNQCTTDTCSTGSCAHINKTDSSGCNDSNECTQNDFCSISSPGTCTGVNLNCAAGDCTACNSGAGYCASGSCTAKLTNGSTCVDSTQCSAGNACATNLSTGAKKCEPATKCIIGGTDVVMDSGTKVCHSADSYTCNSGSWGSQTDCFKDCGLYPNQDSCSNSTGACTSVCATSCINTNDCKADAYCVAGECRSGQGTLCVNNNDCDQGYACTTNQADGQKYCLANANAPKVTSFGVTPTTSSGAFTITYGGSTGDSVQLWRKKDSAPTVDWQGLCDDGQWKSNGCTYLSIPASYADTPGQTGTYTYGLHIIKTVSGTTYVGTETTSGLAPITVTKVQCTAAADCNDSNDCTSPDTCSNNLCSSTNLNCTSSSNCPTCPSGYCSTGVCAAKLASGMACVSDNQCTTELVCGPVAVTTYTYKYNTTYNSSRGYPTCSICDTSNATINCATPPLSSASTFNFSVTPPWSGGLCYDRAGSSYNFFSQYRVSQTNVNQCRTPITYYRDADGDGYGNAAATIQAGFRPTGYVTNNTDCNDANAAIKPGAAEVCDGVDNNCVNGIDEGVKTTYYRDADTDTYGSASVTTAACSAPAGYITDNTDCNDANIAITNCAVANGTGLCSSGACVITCNSGYYLSGGSCLAKKTNGSTCTAATECSTGNCVGDSTKYCCDSTACATPPNAQCYEASGSCSSGSCAYTNKATGTSCGTNMACDASGSCVSTVPPPDFCTASVWAYYDDEMEEDVYNTYYYPQDTVNPHYTCSGYSSCSCDSGYTLTSKGAYGSYSNCYDCDLYVCTDVTWSPSSATVCSDESFTQTSNCGNTRTSPVVGNCTPSCTGKVCGTSNGCATGTCAATCTAGSGCVTVITNCTDLQNMKNNLSASYELANNIDCSATSGWNSGAGFEPIGNNTTPFTGKLDGKSYTVSGLYINRSAINTNGVGLFGGTSGAEIKNIGLINMNITGYLYAGGLVGINLNSVITNAYATGGVSGNTSIGGLIGYNTTGSSITNSYSASTVSGSAVIGGLVGLNGSGGTIANSYSTGAVSGTGDFAGGLAGSNSGTIANSYAVGSVSGANKVGGLAGDMDSGIISNSYATGVVNGSNYVGGLVGYYYSNQPASAISNSYATGVVNGSSYIGGLVGYSFGGTITSSYAAGAVNGTSLVGGLVGTNAGTITNAYSTGAVSGGSLVGGLVGFNNSYYSLGIITNAYSTGAVSGGSLVGGLVGSNTGTINTSYWNKDTSGQLTSSGGGTGFTGLEMTQQATYSGWDFSSNWKIVTPGDYYPCFSWQSNNTCRKACPSGWQSIGGKCLMNAYDNTVSWSAAAGSCSVFGGWLPSVAELDALPCSEFILRPGTGLWGYVRTSTPYSSGHMLYRDTGSYSGCNPYTWCGSDGYSSGTCNLVAIWLEDWRTDYGYVCLRNQQ